MSTLSAPASQDDLAANLPSYCVARDSIDTRASSSFTSRETLIALDYITHRSAGSPSHFSLYEISARSTPNAPFFSTVDLPFYPNMEPSLDTLEDPSDPELLICRLRVLPPRRNCNHVTPCHLSMKKPAHHPEISNQMKYSPALQMAMNNYRRHPMPINHFDQLGTPLLFTILIRSILTALRKQLLSTLNMKTLHPIL